MEQRKILFKAKRLDNSEWVEGYYRENKDGHSFIRRKDGTPLTFEVDPSTVCQFTGLEDRNGVEIWEHDILEDTDTNTFGELTFGCGVFAIDCLPISEYVFDGMLDLAVVCSKFDRKEGEK